VQDVNISAIEVGTDRYLTTFFFFLKGLSLSATIGCVILTSMGMLDNYSLVYDFGPLEVQFLGRVFNISGTNVILYKVIMNTFRYPKAI
jgi:hypothetical protein